MTDEEIGKLSWVEQQEYFNSMPDDELEQIYARVNGAEDGNIMSYEEFKQHTKEKQAALAKHFNVHDYNTGECFVDGCSNEAEYLVGDTRFWCGMCEKCANIRSSYLFKLRNNTNELKKIECEYH